MKVKTLLLSLLCYPSIVISSLGLTANQRPNVVFLSVDDLKPILGAYGSVAVPTPEIDRLASRGTTFLNTYTQLAVCAPSRMSAFTGLRPDSTKVWDLRTHLQDANPEAVTMQQLFKEAGYATAGAGKVMHGARNEHPESWSMPFTPHRQLPFNEDYPVPAHDNAFYQNELSHRVYEELQASDIRDWKERFDYLRERDAMPSTESLDLPDDAYVDGALAVWASRLLEDFAENGEPFFLTVGFAKPHLPFVAPKKYWDLFDRDDIDLAEFRERAANSPEFAYHNFGEMRSYSDITSNWNEDIDEAKQRELIHGYYACVAFIDAQVGKILDKLEETGLADNTIVVFWGDHGYHLGDHGMWNKHSNFEQATHSPLIISAPGFNGNQKAEGMTEFVDIFPTLIELADLEAPYEMEGESLVPVLENPVTEIKEYAISQYPRGGDLMGYALRTERYRLVLWMKSNWRTTMPYRPEFLEEVELYDYAEDPLETVNLASDPAYADVLTELKLKMGEYFASYEADPEAGERERNLGEESSGAGGNSNKTVSQSTSDSAGDRVSGSVPGENFIDLSDPSSLKTDLRFAGISGSEQGLMLDFEVSPKWPSVEFLNPDNSTWDLSNYGAIEVTLTNVGDKAERIFVYAANPYDDYRKMKTSGSGKVDFAPGQTRVVRIPLTAADGFDPSNVEAVRIFTGKHTSPVRFELTGLKVVDPGNRVAEVSTGTVEPQPSTTGQGVAGDNKAVKPEAGNDLVDLGNPGSLKTDLRFAQITPADDGRSLVLGFDLSPKWPSVEFLAPNNSVWNLGDYSAVEIKITNLSEKTENLMSYAANPFEDYRNKPTSGSGKVTFMPGQTQTVRIPLQGVENFNPSAVEAIRIFTGKHTAPFKVHLESMTAVE